MVALLWTFDIFVGAYLTFPVAGPKEARTGAWLWLRRWAPAWLITSHRLLQAVYLASSKWTVALGSVTGFCVVGCRVELVNCLSTSHERDLRY
jgi:hypothetical protein